MQPDPIVEEVRQVRNALAARFNYDLAAIFRDLQDREKKSGRTYVSLTEPRMGEQLERSPK